jgi:hypothetical protein
MQYTPRAQQYVPQAQHYQPTAVQLFGMSNIPEHIKYEARSTPYKPLTQEEREVLNMNPDMMNKVRLYTPISEGNPGGLETTMHFSDDDNIGTKAVKIAAEIVVNIIDKVVNG